MFAEPDRTGLDLSFRLFGFPIRVHPFFWLATILFGSDWFSPDHPQFFLIWVAVVFVSILVHELGHAFAFRACGVGASVVLHAMGGLAIPWDHMTGRWRRVGVSLAGPGAGFLLALAVWASNRSYPWALNGPEAMFAYFSLVWVNVAWGAVNLLPVVPLDGGKVSEEVCGRFARDGTRLSLQISVGTAGAVAVYSLLCVMGRHNPPEWLLALPWWVPRGGLWTAILFGALAYWSYQLLQQTRWTDSHWDR